MLGSVNLAKNRPSVYKIIYPRAQSDAALSSLQQHSAAEQEVHSFFWFASYDVTLQNTHKKPTTINISWQK